MCLHFSRGRIGEELSFPHCLVAVLPFRGNFPPLCPRPRRITTFNLFFIRITPVALIAPLQPEVGVAYQMPGLVGVTGLDLMAPYVGATCQWAIPDAWTRWCDRLRPDGPLCGCYLPMGYTMQVLYLARWWCDLLEQA